MARQRDAAPPEEPAPEEEPPRATPHGVSEREVQLLSALGAATRERETLEERVKLLERETADATASAAHWQVIAEHYLERVRLGLGSLAVELRQFETVAVAQSELKDATPPRYPEDPGRPTVAGLVDHGGTSLRAVPRERDAPAPGPRRQR